MLSYLAIMLNVSSYDLIVCYLFKRCVYVRSCICPFPLYSVRTQQFYLSHLPGRKYH